MMHSTSPNHPVNARRQRRACLLLIAALILVGSALIQPTTPARAASIITVSPAAPNQWLFMQDGSTQTGVGNFVAGPATAPLGVGSAYLETPDTNARMVLATPAYNGKSFSELGSLAYYTYQDPANTGAAWAISLQINIDYDPSDANTGWQGRLAYEPYYSGGAGTVQPGTWQRWDALATNARWWASNTTATGSNGRCTQASPCSWAQVLGFWPNAKVHPAMGAILFKAGGPWAGFKGNVDAFTIGVNNADTTYDFELSPQCTTICYVDAATGSDTNDGSSQATAKKTIQEAVNRVLSGGTVSVAAGTYVEQVDIDKPLTLTGAGQASTVIKAPATLASKFTTGGPTANRPVVYAHDAANVVIQQLGVDGAGVGNANYRLMGIAFRNAGGAVANTTIAHVRNTPLNGMQHGTGLYALNTDGAARTIAISDNTIVDYQKNGMAVIGAGLSATITGNSVTGAGQMGTGLPAQNGIQVSGGAVAPTISGNTISGNFYTAAGAAATGMLISQPGSGTHAIQNNTLTGNQVGMYIIDATDVSVSGNAISGELVQGVESDGIYIYTSAAVNTVGSVSANTIRGHTYGLAVYDAPAAGTLATTASFNRIVGNTVGLYSNVPMAAENNWWGCNAGPGASGCDALENGVADAVDAAPWLVLSLNANPASIPTSGTSSLTASLTRNSDGQDTSGQGSVPDITPAAFSAALGAVVPTNTTTTGGAAASTFTAGAITGSAVITATVDNQTVTATVGIAHPASTLAASPTSLSYSAHQGGASPAPQVVTISNTATGGPLAWSVGAPVYAQGASGWLSCTPGAGTALAPAASTTVTCSATTGGLLAGTYTASFEITSGTPGVTGSPQTVSVTFVVGPQAGITVAPASGSVQVAEGGASDTYSVVLTSQPAANVVITVASGNETTAAPTSLTFTPANWNVPQTVTVTAVDDAEVEGAHTVTLSHTSSSADADYDQIAIGQVVVAIADNDASKPNYKVYLPMLMQTGALKAES